MDWTFKKNPFLGWLHAMRYAICEFLWLVIWIFVARRVNFCVASSEEYEFSRSAYIWTFVDKTYKFIWTFTTYKFLFHNWLIFVVQLRNFVVQKVSKVKKRHPNVMKFCGPTNELSLYWLWIFVVQDTKFPVFDYDSLWCTVYVTWIFVARVI